MLPQAPGFMHKNLPMGRDHRRCHADADFSEAHLLRASDTCYLLLVVRPGTTSSVLAPSRYALVTSSDALVTSSFLSVVCVLCVKAQTVVFFSAHE